VVGLCASFLVRRAGAFTVIGVDPIALRRQAGLRMGLDAALDPADGEPAAQVRARNGGQLADVILETSGAIPALNDAFKAIRPQSTIVPLSWYSADASALDLTGDFHLKRVHLRVAQGGSVPLHLSSRWTYERRVESTLRLLPSMPLDSLVTHDLPFEEAPEAYELVHAHPEQCIQVVFSYPRPH
jgi:threonine dehydrogenase-like Zn-dependent dehydrogenase